MQKLILLSIVSLAFVLGEQDVCENGKKIWIEENEIKILMKCQNGQWKGIVKKKKGAPGGPPCTDSPAMNNTCPAERGHCLQFTEKGAKMDGNCPGNCDSCDGCRCQDNHQWHTYCPFWQQYCGSAGVLGNWMTTNCKKTCGKCKCKCCSFNGNQHGVGASIPLPKKCGEIVCEEGLMARFSPLLSGAAEHVVTHPEELTLNFRKLHPGSDCCMLPGNARDSNGSLMPNVTMVVEGWKGMIGQVPSTCCHGILCTPLQADIPTGKNAPTTRTTSTSTMTTTTTSTTTTTTTTKTTPTTTTYNTNHRQCTDPHQTLKDPWRRIVYGVKQSPAIYHCDTTGSGSGVYTAFKLGWYRFYFPEAPYAKIPTSPPKEEDTQSDMKSCGTHRVSWIEDSMPTVGQPPKDVTIFFAWISDEKARQRAAKVVACQEGKNIYYVYYLEPVGSCYGAYCAL